MSTIGILGGGQLGLMLAQAAHALGHRVAIYASPGDNVAFREADLRFEAGYDDQRMLGAFALALQGGPVTLEFENVPLETLNCLAGLGVCVHPSRDVLAAAQDRAQEKWLSRQLGIPTTPFLLIARDAPMKEEAKLYLPGILKTTRLGYDGRGQERVATYAQLKSAVSRLGNQPLILERVVDFEYEMSVIVARNAEGKVIFFPSTQNRHKDGILRETLYDASAIPWDVVLHAQRATRRLVDSLGVVGLLAVEFFVTPERRVLFNEMAPRPHNSGHWTIEGCKTSQFTACIQAITGAPLGDPAALGRAQMVNLLGEEIRRVADRPGNGVFVHDYGKAELRPGRKMGHITYIG